MIIETVSKQFQQNTRDLFNEKPKLLFVKFEDNMFIESSQYIIDMLNLKRKSYRLLKDMSCLLVHVKTEKEARKLKEAIDQLYLLHIPVSYLHQYDSNNWLFDAQNKIDDKIGFQGCNYVEPDKEHEIKDVIKDYSDFQLLKTINFRKERESLRYISNISKDYFVESFSNFMMDNSTFFSDKKDATKFINIIYDIESTMPLKDVRDMNVSTNMTLKSITKAFINGKQEAIKTDQKTLNDVATILRYQTINDFIEDEDSSSYDMQSLHNLVNPEHSMSKNNDAYIIHIDNHHISDEINCGIFSKNNSHMCEMEHSVKKTSYIASLIGENIRHFIAIKQLYVINRDLLELSRKVIDPEFPTNDFLDRLHQIFNQ